MGPSFKPPDSWTLRFLRDHWRLMTPASLLRYRGFLVRDGRGASHPEGPIGLWLRGALAGGVELRARGADPYTFREVMVHEVYGPVVERVPRAAYVVDLGANIGLSARYFAARYPGCRILAVEPDPGNFELLGRNVAELVRLGRCRTLRAAAWGRRGKVAMTGPAGTVGHHNALAAVEGESGDVEALTVPEILAHSGFPRVDVLKVDIEGGEAHLFRGDLSWLDRVGAIAIEFHGESRRRGGFDSAMRDHGFEVDDSHPHTAIAVGRRGSP